MLYDFRFPRPQLTEFCFRFRPYYRKGPPLESPQAEGEVQVWVFLNNEWYGPYGIGLQTQAGHFAQSTDLMTPERQQVQERIYECKHRLMDIQRQKAGQAGTLTGDLLMSEYVRQYPFSKSILSCDPV